VDVGKALDALLSRNSEVLEYFPFGFECFLGFSDPQPGAMLVPRAVSGLCRNHYLRILHLLPAHRNLGESEGGVPVSAEISEEIFEVLRASNATLLRMKGFAYKSAEDRDRSQYLLLLNRYGRDFVASGRRNVPAENWGEVPMWISSCDCNYLATELVRQGRGIASGTSMNSSLHESDSRVYPDRTSFSHTCRDVHPKCLK
jgi:hypothetical protein